MQEAWIDIHKIASREFDRPFIYSNKVKPFLKWAGGKGQLLLQYEKFLQISFNNYIEPFLGGGAVFFHLYSTGRFNSDKKIMLIDSNSELIDTYNVIKNEVKQLILTLLNSKYKNNEDVYYKIREKTPTDQVDKAARTIYLNKTCFNGLYRVNSKNKFNVPFGGYKNPTICNIRNLLAVHNTLQNVKLIAGDFEKCLEYAKKDDFIYFDPPYQPISITSSFTNYTKNSFDEKNQERLAEVIKELDKKKCKVMLSNSDTQFIRKLYKNFSIEVVKARRAINCKASGRGEINELVIINY